MGFFIARVSGALLGLVLALLAFVLQTVLRARLRKNDAAQIGPGLTVLSVLGAAGAVYIFVITVLNLLKYRSGLGSIATVSAPLLLFSAALAANFAIMLFAGPSKPDTGRLALSSFAAALAGALQFALLILNLGLRWNNFTRGMAEYLYIQVLLLAIAAINTGLFFITFFKLKDRRYVLHTGG
ncbi:MAG: hypothetical protein LBL20_02505 [Treponema sp.]|jgi:hypothetical protein|nr:hypothetical protein [Treponema sp.]